MAPMQGEGPHEAESEPEGSVRAQGQREKPGEPEKSRWEAAERRRRTALAVRLVLGGILLVLFVIFVSLNSDSVQVHFVFFETRTPLVWVFLICALIGGLVAFLLGRSGRRASRKYIKELERRLERRRERG
jgi:uncharacterized integral membrane protein